MNRIIVFFILFFKTYCSAAQNDLESPVIHLNKFHGNVADISKNALKYTELSDPVFKDFPQQLVKNKKGLFLALVGSGKLYKALANKNTIRFERQDSTIYFGDNFDSFFFSFRDTIYSLGGYGFWVTKGILRYYVEPRREWEVMRLNREIPIVTGQKNDLLWYDQRNGTIYFTITKEINSISNEPVGKFLNQVWALNLEKKEWEKLGIITPYLRNNLSQITNIISSPYGQFASLKTENIFLDYNLNRIYRLSEARQRELELLPTNNGEQHVYYFIDSIFYSWLPQRKLVDSLKISIDDLVPLGEKIYQEEAEVTRNEFSSTRNNQMNLWIITVIFLVGFLVGYFLHQKTKKQIKINFEGNINERNSAIKFSTLELELISSITQNSSKGQFTSIEDVNNALGVSKKNSEIQKKQRSDIISAINKKYSYIKRSDNELIEKRRTEFDKRSFEYFIDASRLADAVQLIKGYDLSNGS